MQHPMILYCVNVGLSLWAGMADWRIDHGNPKFTCHSRTSPSLEQRAYCRSNAPAETKTQKPVRFETSEGTRASVEKWMEDVLMVGSEYLWPGRFHERLHNLTRQYARIVRDWVTSIGLDASAYGTNSLRRTKVTQIYRKTGNLSVVQHLLGCTKMDGTVRYLGVELEGTLTIAEAIEI
ncbi:tyrosine-type recombinase/integrase [Ruegeria sp. MALMAid1280]|uniref:tyrosine-type recombinase/integrase n=1 Tax=Ruegeria sp. MALMAid1280 TaxID=3411634 RepID=UPI003BA33518